MTIHNLSTVPESAAEHYGQGAVSLMLSRLAGSERLAVNCDIVPPGAASAKYHAHTLQEEFFFILEGEGVLRDKAGEHAVHAGDFMAKPAGLDNPHQFRCVGEVPLKILDISLKTAGDVAHYPDDGVYLLRDTGIALGGAAPEGWTSEP